jgi:hypothetical protein
MRRAITTIRERLRDGADLIIDFATLGEYGLEPLEPTCRAEPCAPLRLHEPRRLAEQPQRIAA